jgi:hypothetical protein
MSNNKPKSKTTSDAVPTPKKANVGEQRESIVKIEIAKYVVVRDNLRVSDKEYITADDPAAVNERDFWQRVVNRFPDGTKVNIVEYDKKRHRVW